MTSRDFAYWLQGFFEIYGTPTGGLNSVQTEKIRAHLAMVFLHEIDPSMGDEKHQAELSALHDQLEKGNETLKDAINRVEKKADAAQATANKPKWHSPPVMRC